MNSELFQAVLEEYKSLRAEAVAARDAQLAVLRVGVTLIAALVGAGVGLRNQQYLGAVILGVIVPFIVFFTIELWVGEIERSVRAGAFVAAIEQRVARHFALIDLEEGGAGGAHLNPPMGWETWLRRKPPAQDHRVWYRPPKPSEQQRASLSRGVVIFSFLLLVAVMSCGTGLHFMWHQHLRSEMWAMAGFDLLMVVIFIVRAFKVFAGIDRRDTAPDPDEVWEPLSPVPA